MGSRRCGRGTRCVAFSVAVFAGTGSVHSARADEGALEEAQTFASVSVDVPAHTPLSLECAYANLGAAHAIVNGVDGPDGDDPGWRSTLWEVGDGRGPVVVASTGDHRASVDPGMSLPHGGFAVGYSPFPIATKVTMAWMVWHQPAVCTVRLGDTIIESTPRDTSKALLGYPDDFGGGLAVEAGGVARVADDLTLSVTTEEQSAYVFGRMPIRRELATTRRSITEVDGSTVSGRDWWIHLDAPPGTRSFAIDGAEVDGSWPALAIFALPEGLGVPDWVPYYGPT